MPMCDFNKLFSAIWKTLLQLLLVFPFTPSLFDFRLYELLQIHSKCDYMAYKLIKYNQFQISENKPNENAINYNS